MGPKSAVRVSRPKSPPSVANQRPQAACWKSPSCSWRSASLFNFDLQLRKGHPAGEASSAHQLKCWFPSGILSNWHMNLVTILHNYTGSPTCSVDYTRVRPSLWLWKGEKWHCDWCHCGVSSVTVKRREVTLGLVPLWSLLSTGFKPQLRHLLANLGLQPPQVCIPPSIEQEKRKRVLHSLACGGRGRRRENGCMCACSGVCVCAETRGWQWLSSSIVLYLLFWNKGLFLNLKLMHSARQSGQ